MPKANRCIEVGRYYHLTHRCHGRAFLLRFGKDRDVYREMLRGRLKDYATPLLGYTITANHVHLLMAATREKSISMMTDALEGDFAQYYNLRKQRSGACWGGRFHSTAIEPGGHLWRCLVYIELNMVRAGVVRHPRDWRWISYQELMVDPSYMDKFTSACFLPHTALSRFPTVAKHLDGRKAALSK